MAGEQHTREALARLARHLESTSCSLEAAEETLSGGFGRLALTHLAAAKGSLASALDELLDVVGVQP